MGVKATPPRKPPPFDPTSPILRGPNFRQLMAERSSQITVERLKKTKQSEILELGEMGLACVVAADLADPQKLWVADLRQAAEECWAWCHLIMWAKDTQWKDVESAAGEILVRVKAKREEQEKRSQTNQKEIARHVKN